MKITLAILCSVVLLAPAMALAQPLLRYTFDEASGNALDTGAAPAADSTLEGGAVRSADTPSGAGSSLDMRTDAPVAHLLGPDAAELDGLSALTLATWLKVETYVSGNNRLVAKQAGGTFGGFSWNMNATTNDGPVGPDNFRLGMFIGNNLSSGPADFGSAFSTADVDAASKWVFLAVTYDSAVASGNTNFYIGDAFTPVAPLGSSATLPQLTIDAGAARFGVGFTDAAPAANTSVLGWQDDVRVYGAALDLATLDAVREENASAGPFFHDGDFNLDGEIDGEDLAAWQIGYGEIGTATRSDGDADGDDFLIWQREVGLPTPPTGAAPVPEPASLLLLAAAAAGILARRR